MTRIATSWLVYRLTGSAFLLDVVGFAGLLPSFLLAPLAGVLIDCWSRHRLVVVTQILALLQALALAVLTMSGIVIFADTSGFYAPRGKRDDRHAEAPVPPTCRGPGGSSVTFRGPSSICQHRGLGIGPVPFGEVVASPTPPPPAAGARDAYGCQIHRERSSREVAHWILRR